MNETHGKDPISDSGEDAEPPESELDAELEDDGDVEAEGPIAFS